MRDTTPCPVCGLRFALNKEHYNLVHLGEAEKRCLFCAYLFDTINLMFNHITEHDGSVFCFLCKQSFINHELLLDHINTHSELHIYGCKECCWTCANKITFLEHTCHDVKEENSSGHDSGIESNPVIVSSTSKCDRVDNIELERENKLTLNSRCISNKFKDKIRLKFIASCLKSDGYYHCTDCTKRLRTARGFKYHLFKHNNLLNFGCEECGKRFPNNSKLQAHTKLHNMRQKYPCPECGNLYKTKYSLAIHSVQHRGGFICAHCSSVFTRKHQIKIHLNVKECCGEILRCRTLFVEHIRNTAHIFQCEFCTSRFINDTYLKRHVAIFHRTAVGTHRCLDCGLLCVGAHNLARHKRRTCSVLRGKNKE